VGGCGNSGGNAGLRPAAKYGEAWGVELLNFSHFSGRLRLTLPILRISFGLLLFFTGNGCWLK